MEKEFLELLKKSLQESVSYKEKVIEKALKEKSSAPKEPEELVFINSLNEEDKEIFMNLLDDEFCFIYYPGYFQGYAKTTNTDDWDERYYEVKNSFLRTRKVYQTYERDIVVEPKKTSIFQRIRSRKGSKK